MVKFNLDTEELIESWTLVPQELELGVKLAKILLAKAIILTFRVVSKSQSRSSDRNKEKLFHLLTLLFWDRNKSS